MMNLTSRRRTNPEKPEDRRLVHDIATLIKFVGPQAAERALLLSKKVTVKDLRRVARGLAIQGFHSMDKAELVERIIVARNSNNW